MQAWQRQTSQCIFCAFRLSKQWSRPAQRAPGVAFSSQIRRTGPSKHVRGDKEAPRSRRGSRRDELDPRIRKDAGRPPDFRRSRGHDDAEPLRNLIPHALNTLEARMRNKLCDEESGKREMEQLDPDGTRWPAYKARILKLAPSHPELYIGFLDQVFKNPDTTEIGRACSLVDIRYPTEWYLRARMSQRTIHLHVGPTNSGKTYNALKRLQETKNGFYAGPLRLLAHEVYSRLRANGIPCDLVTGDDVRFDGHENTKVYASTVEMVNCSRECEVAVIDEIQMMGSTDRGWAWTRAFLGANAKEVHLCGETRVIPLIRELTASMGDSLKIHRYDRLNPSAKGDCVVAFSIVQIHALKKQIELETGKRCAIVYGSLPPETRAQQADLFNDPDNDYDYLVASDAIGMGLNLSIKRIIFNSVTKWDGGNNVQLTVPQIKQIAGRAGRYRTSHQDRNNFEHVPAAEENVGWVTCIDEVDLPIIRAALETEAPPMKRAGILPPAEYLEEYAATLPTALPFEFLLRKVCNAATIHPRFFLCDLKDKLTLARITDDVANLTIEQRVTLCAAPSGSRNPIVLKCLKALATAISKNAAVTIVDIKEIPLEILAEQPRADRSYLESLETLHQCLIVYLWLSYRFIRHLRDQPMAIHAKELTEQKINWTLMAFSANPKLRERLTRLQGESPEEVKKRLNAQLLKQANLDLALESTDAQRAKQQSQGSDLIRIGDGEETLDEHFSRPSLIAEEDMEDDRRPGERPTMPNKWKESGTGEEPTSTEVVAVPDEANGVHEVPDNETRLQRALAHLSQRQSQEGKSPTPKAEYAETVDVSPGEQAQQRLYQEQHEEDEERPKRGNAAG